MPVKFREYTPEERREIMRTPGFKITMVLYALLILGFVFGLAYEAIKFVLTHK